MEGDDCATAGMAEAAGAAGDMRGVEFFIA